jgi:hypothetical protein
VEQNFHQPDHPRVVDLAAGDAGAAGSNRQSQKLEEREIDVHVERFGSML